MARNTVWSSELRSGKGDRVNEHVAEAWYGLGDAHRFAGDYDAEKAYEALKRDQPRLLEQPGHYQ